MKISYEQVIDFRKKLKKLEHRYNSENTLFHWEWWILVFLTFAPWIIWWLLVDKKRIKEIAIFGFFIMIVTCSLDSIGSNLIWWGYPHELIAIIPPLVPVDLSVIPCFMMLVYQYFSKWKSYLIALSCFSFLATYVGESVFIWMGYFVRIFWKPYESILFYMISGVIGKWLINKLTQIETKSRKK